MSKTERLIERNGNDLQKTKEKKEEMVQVLDKINSMISEKEQQLKNLNPSDQQSFRPETDSEFKQYDTEVSF